METRKAIGAVRDCESGEDLFDGDWWLVSRDFDGSVEWLQIVVCPGGFRGNMLMVDGNNFLNCF